ncbi:MAG: 4-hydroxyphenylacetate 3-hydroxylase N-terminal domain-containing protein [Pseudomonadota bacterium]|nr:4-hydroxyphenylacetate 3-hydroxylase N-terminal domain-containing protein [Pseudomonadota bacterium]
MARTGAAYLDSLIDERAVFLDGERVEKITTHPAFQQAARSIAALYDFHSAAENLQKMTYRSPKTGEQVNRMWQLPTNYNELVNRREALTSWAETHFGFMGRSPDHVASTLSAFYMGSDIYKQHGNDRAAAVREYYEYARDNDLYVSYVIIDPQGDRSKSRSESGNADLTVSICDQDNEGITIKGAKMLGTGAVLSDEVLVSTLRPMNKGEERWAFTAVLPMQSPGLKLLSRRSYEAAATSLFDYPLSKRFDENDALLYFDEVKVPWERVFVCRDIETQFAQWHSTPAHSYQNYQSEIRLTVKLRFLVGLAKRIAEMTGAIKFPQIIEKLGWVSSQLQVIEAFVYAMEVKGWRFGEYYLPNKELLYASQVQSQNLYPKIIETLRDLAGGGMIMLPSSIADFEAPEIAELIGKTQYSPAASSEERVKFFKLAWDAIGSEFGSRHTQYEMFYSGSSVVTTGMAFRTFEWERTTNLVDDCLNSYQTPTSRSQGHSS